MYQIAVCDDDENELAKTQSILSVYQAEHPEYKLIVKGFTSVNELLFNVAEGKGFDLILLDIYMPEKNGIEGARALRENGFDGDIVFLTTSREHAIDAFDVEAVQYLLKPVDQDKLFAVLDKLLGKIEESARRYITIKSEGVVRRIPICNIVYSESQNQYQWVHHINQEIIRVRIPLKELYEMVKDYSDFVRVGSTYIVNLSYVDSLNAKTINLTTGKEIWIPRGSYATLKEQYFKFYRER